MIFPLLGSNVMGGAALNFCGVTTTDRYTPPLPVPAYVQANEEPWTRTRTFRIPDTSRALSSEHTGTGDGAATNFAGVRREAEPPHAVTTSVAVVNTRQSR